MITTEKIEPLNVNESNTINASKANKWNEQPHIGKYKLIKTIGKGNFAKVKLAQHVTTGKKVAVKVIDKTALNNSSLQKLFREVKIMKTIDHPNIVKLFEVIESERHVYLVMEYASRGEVFDFLVQNGRMKEKDARQRFREIVSAIQYCHQKQIVHRDLKAENLLLSSDLQIKIADFGFANNFDSKKQLDTFCGSPPYAAPELFQGRKYEGPEVDVWSLGVILYTLVSGSLPFDGHNMRELRERVLRGKYRIPFYMTTDCETLLKKMLIVNPQKRYTLLDVMKDKWINIGYEDNILQPFIEPKKNYEDPVRLAIMETLGFSKAEVFDSLYNAKFNNVTATYLLLDHDVNNTLENSSKSDSGSSLKNINSYLSQKDQSKQVPPTTGTNESSVTRSGSALESRTNSKVNGDNKESTANDNTKHVTLGDDESSNVQNSFKGKSSSRTPHSIKPSPSMNTATTHSNDEVPQLGQGLNRSRPNAIRIPGIQPNINLLNQKSNKDKSDMNNGDNLAVPVKTSTWVKRNNTFTYADKNTTSEVESKPVTRTKNVMNILSHVTPATVPLPMDQPMSSMKKHTVNETNTKTSKKFDANIHPPNKVSLNEEIMKTDSNCDILVKGTDKPNATGDKLCTNTMSSNDSNVLLASSDENDPNPQNLPDKNVSTLNSVTNSVSSSKEKTEMYPQLNKPKQIHSNSLFRSFTNKISTKTNAGPELNINETLSPYDNSEVSQQFRRYSTGDKLIRRLTSQHPSNKNKQTVNEELDHDQNNTDPWTPMDVTSITEKRKISASSDLTEDNHSSLDQNITHQNFSLKSTQSKPRVMHLVFRKSLTSKLRPDTIVSEMLKSLQFADEINFAKIEQIDTFVIECQGKLKSEQGGNELIHWEIEVFRLPRSSSFGIRIKKQSGSSTRFKAIHKILINKLSPVLCANATVASTN